MTKFTANQIHQVPIKKIKPWENNARTHSEYQIQLLAKAIEEFGFTTPVLMKSNGTLVAGHGRVEAAKLVGMNSVPAIWVDHLSDRQIRALVIADNKIASLSGWDYEKLAEEISALAEVEYDLELTGLDEQEIDQMLRESFDLVPDTLVNYSKPVQKQESSDLILVNSVKKPTSMVGDVWDMDDNIVLIVGNKTKRSKLTELGPSDCDETIMNWQEKNNGNAIHRATGKTFDQLNRERN
jgi:hypothetical protein